MLNLLKLEAEVIEKLKAAGETFSKKILGEKTLRQIVNSDLNEQIKKVTSILNKSTCKL